MNSACLMISFAEMEEIRPTYTFLRLQDLKSKLFIVIVRCIEWNLYRQLSGAFIHHRTVKKEQNKQIDLTYEYLNNRTLKFSIVQESSSKLLVV